MANKINAWIIITFSIVEVHNYVAVYSTYDKQLLAGLSSVFTCCTL